MEKQHTQILCIFLMFHGEDSYRFVWCKWLTVYNAVTLSNFVDIRKSYIYIDNTHGLLIIMEYMNCILYMHKICICI